MLLTSEKKVGCPIETNQSVDIKVIDRNVNANRELYQSSDKTIDSQETISYDTMLTSSNVGTKKLERVIAGPKSARNLNLRTPKRISKDTELTAEHNIIWSENSEDFFSPALFKRNSTTTFKQPISNFVAEQNVLGLIIPQFSS